MAVEKVGQDESKAKRATCANCGAVLKYYPKDVEVKSYSCMGESDTYSFIVCPECKKQVAVR